MKAFYHSADLDGHCAGAIIKHEYPDCEMIGINYGQPFPWESIQYNEHIFMVDFSLQPFEDMIRLNAISNLIWIDHHKSAIDAALKAEFQAYEQKLEIGKAGCELTWDFLYPDSLMPLGVFLLGRYDVWDLEAHPEVMNFQFGMRTKKETLPGADIWCALFGKNQDSVVMTACYDGRIAQEYQISQSAKYAESHAFETQIDGLPAIAMNIGMANSQMFASVWDPGRHKIMMPFVWRGNQWTVSLYTTPETGVDVSEIAKRRGGGGHQQAAGFQSNKLPFKCVQ